LTSIINSRIRTHFGNHLMEQVSLRSYTTARVGGLADGLIEVKTEKELAETVLFLWAENIPVKVIGFGSNLLVSDKGYRGIIVVNRSSDFSIEDGGNSAVVQASSGINFSRIAREVSMAGWSGLEWASGIPGSVGGAVYGNAGAHGSNMTSNLIESELLHPSTGITRWDLSRFGYGYRTSEIKRSENPAIIIHASLAVTKAAEQEIIQKLDAFTAKRKTSQPTGASLGSIFKNPVGDYAGRLIEGAGLKGRKIGGAEISSKHANFFINSEKAGAVDIYQLICLAQDEVEQKYGIKLDTEIELLGSFKDGEE